MKVLLVFAALCIGGIMGIPTPEQIATIFGPYEYDCASQYIVSEDEIKALKAGQFSNLNGNEKCFLQCVMLANGINDSNGDIVPEKVKAAAPNLGVSPKDTDALIKACSKTYSLDACENGAGRSICYYNNL